MNRNFNYFQTKNFNQWFYKNNAKQKLAWWDELFNISFKDLREKLVTITARTVERANPTKIYPYTSKEVFRDLLENRNGWVIVCDDDDLLSSETINFLAGCENYDELVYWSALISFPFKEIDNGKYHYFDITEGETYRIQPCQKGHPLFSGTYAIHTSNNVIKMPYEKNVLFDHMLTANVDKRFFAPNINSVYTGLISFSRIQAARNKWDFCNFINQFKKNRVRYPAEFKQEEIEINELMQSVQFTEYGKEILNNGPSNQ
jgi:hypothetical protein